MAFPAGIIIDFMGLMAKGDTIHPGFKPFLVIGFNQENIRLVALHPGDLLDFRDLVLLRKIMATAASDRSGSHLLCQVLAGWPGRLRVLRQ